MRVDQLSYKMEIPKLKTSTTDDHCMHIVLNCNINVSIRNSIASEELQLQLNHFTAILKLNMQEKNLEL